MKCYFRLTHRIGCQRKITPPEIILRCKRFDRLVAKLVQMFTLRDNDVNSEQGVLWYFQMPSYRPKSDIRRTVTNLRPQLGDVRLWTVWMVSAIL